MDATPSRWFTAAFREGFPSTVDRMLAILARVDDSSYAYCALALRDAALRRRLTNLSMPLTVIVGADDPVIPLVDAQAATDAAPSGSMRVIERSSHLAVVESTAAVVSAMFD